MVKKVLVLGTGLVGRPMALDLANDPQLEVGVADYYASALQPFAAENIRTHQADLTDAAALAQLIDQYDLFINAVPGAIGFGVLKQLAGSGKKIVDIAFYPENPFDLQEIAHSSGSVIVCDMGVAPGMSHLLSGYAASKLDQTQKILIYVGGLPVVRKLPWEYKAVFSPSDVIEEYTRVARLVENGRMVEKEALSESEMIDFEGIGTLEAFNSDGLRSLVTTLQSDYMAEKTLRYPGHIDKIKLLKQMGLFGEKPILVDGKSVVPLEFTKKMLFNDWKLQPGEEDLTVMRILVEGVDAKGTRKRYTFDLTDYYDGKSGIHSMARTTGYAATAALRLLAKGLWTEPGVHLPEMLGKSEETVAFILKRLEERGIVYHQKKEILA